MHGDRAALAFQRRLAMPARSSIASSPTASSAAAASRVPGSSDNRPTGELRLASTSISVVRSARRYLAPKGGSSSTLTIPTRRSSASENGADDLFFLDGSEIIDHRLAGNLTLGPAVFFVSTAAMVHGRAPFRRLSDLAGKSICFYQGSNAHRHLEGWAAAHRLTFVRMGYMEYGELYDAYNAGICDAQVGESPDLAAARLNEGAKPPSRILAEALATFPIFAATPASDPQWSAIVAWAVFALERAELPATPWAASGLDSAAVEGREFGLADDWLKRVVGAAGSYADIYARNLGEGSRLKLPRGPNAPVEPGGLFVTPYRE